MSDWEATELSSKVDQESTPSADLVATALAVATTLEGTEEHSMLIEEIAVAYMQSGNLNTAVELVETISDPYVKDHALGAVARISFDNGDAETGQALLEEIQDPGSFAIAIEQIALSYAERGKFEQALTIAGQAPDQVDIEGGIAVLQAKSGHLEEALELARNIDIPASRTTAIAHLAMICAENEQSDRAYELLDEAKQAAEEAATDFPEDSIGELVYIASIFGRLGQKDVGLDVLLEAKQICESIDRDSSSRDTALGLISDGLAGLGYLKVADEVLENIEDPFQFAAASASLAVAYHQNGNEENCVELLKQAVEIVTEVDPRREQTQRLRDQLFARLADTYVRCGRYQECCDVFKLITSNYFRRSFALDFAARYTGTGVDTFRFVELISEATDRTDYWMVVSDAFLEKKDFEQATRALNKSLEVLNQIEKNYDKCVAFAEIASRLANRNQPGLAKSTLLSALSLVVLVEAPNRKASALLTLARKYAALGLTPGESEATLLEEIVAGL